MIYNLVESNSPILKEVMPKFEFGKTFINPNELAINLTETMIANKGLGLAANQCGLKYRVFVMNANPVLALFNPIIVDSSEEEVLMEEGCLSYPNFYVKIKRAAAIRARFSLANGETTTQVFEGLTARIFQHELDHLNGIIHKDRATKYHKELALNQMKKRIRNGHRKQIQTPTQTLEQNNVG